MSPHIVVLSNPVAGRGRAIKVATRVCALLAQAGFDVQEIRAADATQSHALVATALSSSPLALVVVGGDGTLRGVLDLLCEHDVPLIPVAGGTGNDFIRALGLSSADAADVVTAAASGQVRSVDVGEVHSAHGVELFLTVAALGFDAKVSRRTDALVWPHGRLRYYLALVVELARLRPMRFTMTIDGAADVDAPGTLIAVGNTATYGGGMPICVGAVPDDGEFDVVHVAPIGRMRLLRLFPRLLRGTHLDHDVVTHQRARSITVREPDLSVYADGEPVAMGQCTITIRPAALSLLVPPGPVDGR